MAISKVIYAGEALIDLTADSVTPATLLAGITAHDAAGNLITGAMTSSVDPYGALEAVLTD